MKIKMIIEYVLVTVHKASKNKIILPIVALLFYALVVTHRQKGGFYDELFKGLVWLFLCILLGFCTNLALYKKTKHFYKNRLKKINKI